MGQPERLTAECPRCGKVFETWAMGTPDLDADPALGDPGWMFAAAEATCPHCHADLHSCTHCAAFDSGARNECRQGGATLPDGSREARVAKKTQRNECVLFTAKATQEFAKEETRAPDDPRAAFDALFKK